MLVALRLARQILLNVSIDVVRCDYCNELVLKEIWEGPLPSPDQSAK